LRTRRSLESSYKREKAERLKEERLKDDREEVRDGDCRKGM
jgi:hypothetical protein